jgi:hypothetical protein
MNTMGMTAARSVADRTRCIEVAPGGNDRVIGRQKLKRPGEDVKRKRQASASSKDVT